MLKLLFIPFLLFNSLFAYPTCCPHLEQALAAIYRYPAGKELIAQVEKEGPLNIYCAPFTSKSPAMWVTGDRAIVINTNQRHTFGEVVRSIFFELHNALTDRKFIELDQLAERGGISKNGYVEGIERIEHQNARTVARSIEKAIRSNYFPADSWWPIPFDFETHYRIQRETGHSNNIAAIYDQISRSNYYGYSR